MRLRELGLLPVPLATRVRYTHRASSYRSGSLSDVRNYDDYRAAKELLCPDAPDASLALLERPVKEFSAGARPETMTKWIVAWPAPGHGHVVGLTYRAEGIYQPGRKGGMYDDDAEQAYLREYARYPLYLVRRSLTSSNVLVPPWALYKIEDDEAERPDDRPDLHERRAFVDYADSLIPLIDPKGDPDASTDAGPALVRPDEGRQARPEPAAPRLRP